MKRVVEVPLYRDKAVVLRAWKLGEADRIISLHTLDNGKVRAVAKGIRRTRSKFGARLEPSSHVALQLFRGKGELDTITQVETISQFVSLQADPEFFAQVESLLEAVECVAQEREPDPHLHVMLLKALATLSQRRSSLVVSAFFLKLLAHEGLRPQLDECVSCGIADALVAFDLHEGGVLCGSCRRGRPISSEALAAVRGILGGGLAGVLGQDSVEATSEWRKEVRALSTALMEHHLERRLRSMAVLERT